MQNDTDVFVEIQPLRRNFELTDRWILHDLESNRFFKYRHVNMYSCSQKLVATSFLRAISSSYHGVIVIGLEPSKKFLGDESSSLDIEYVVVVVLFMNFSVPLT